MATILARLLNQYLFKYQTIFSAAIDKQDEKNEVLEEIDVYNILNNNPILSQFDIDKIIVRFQLDHQTFAQEMKDSEWRFDEINSMTIYFYETTKLNGSKYVKLPLRPAAILNIKDDDEYCFLWSILAQHQPCGNSLRNRISNNRECFTELSNQVFDFSNRSKCSDVNNFEKLYNFFSIIFELNFNQNHKEWKQKLIPVEISKNNTNRVFDLLIYKNHYVIINK